MKVIILLFLIFVYVSYICYYTYPPIKYFEDVFSIEECKEIIKYGKSKLQRSLVDSGEDGEKSEDRTSSSTWIVPSELPCLLRASHFVAKITGLPVQNQELWQLLYYKPGQEYKEHYDAISPDSEDSQGIRIREKKRGWGPRIFTFFIYLNDVEEGGETHFPKLGLNIKPKRGRAVLWENLNEYTSEAHPMSEHAGLPPKKGEKWAINVWVRQNPEKY